MFVGFIARPTYVITDAGGSDVNLRTQLIAAYGSGAGSVPANVDRKSVV